MARPARPGLHVCQLMLLMLLSGSVSSSERGNSEAFASDRAAAVHVLRPLFPLMDCEAMGVVGKGEVDEHFFQLFYSVARRGSFSIGRNDLKRAFSGSSDGQIAYIFSIMDGDGDGVVSTEEFRSFMLTILDLTDAEHNGEVSLADLGLEAPRIVRAQQR